MIGVLLGVSGAGLAMPGSMSEGGLMTPFPFSSFSLRFSSGFGTCVAGFRVCAASGFPGASPATAAPKHAANKRIRIALTLRFWRSPRLEEQTRQDLCSAKQGQSRPRRFPANSLAEGTLAAASGSFILQTAREENMRTFALALAAATLFTLAAPASARDYDNYGGYHHRWGRYGYGADCRELRRACLYKQELGEVGRGNCERYRRLCS